jgi:FlaA1/EpsC-like NDP-sugar epimerase
LACILGKSGEIFFPKLGEEQMLTFSEIATAFLKELGYAPDFCSSEQQAKEKAALLDAHSTTYPVYYFGSDTSGEKSFEEFYTEGEQIDLARFCQLGVIENAPKRMMKDINKMFSKLRKLFKQEKLDKSAVVKLLGEFIPNFEHIETGKSLDQKM